ncbi:MAG: hypothetical protein DCC56_12145 [Anaerolineae bacterium]|nr:MAG: hypothetical protein DCC56_12145 [Anaerolineae bacterium]WKZ42298.1 MAG: hypothetical protein QY302_09340 [Anaerolineales bacterium]
MNKTVVSIILTILIFVFLSFLPIFPMLLEVRESSSSGESLYQEWRLVSLGEYYESAIFARSAWRETTKVVYYALAVVHLAVTIFVSWLAGRIGLKFASRVRGMG